MNLLFVGDFRVNCSSGYSVILANLCGELSRMGHRVTLVGLDWPRTQHDYAFQIIPSDFTWVPVQITRLHQALRFDHCVLAMDIPKIESVLGERERQKLDWPPTSGLFPVESDPLISNWAKAVEMLRTRLVISQYGVRILGDGWGLGATHLPVTAQLPNGDCDQLSARLTLSTLRPFYGDSKLLAKAGPIVLTVADNQERKSLPIIGQALAILRDAGLWVTWLLVTTPSSPYGWTLSDLMERLWINDQVVVLGALTEEELSCAYTAASIFALSSSAEGACLPLYEAMAHRLPCIAPRHTAITEALDNGRGTLLSPESTSISCWGNVNRYHITPASMADAIQRVIDNPPDVELGYEFVSSRSWAGAATIVEEALSGQKA